MKTLHVLAITETAALFLARALKAPDAITFTVIGMMVVTFGYIFENVLKEKTSKGSRLRRRLIVLALFALVVVAYWLLGLV